MFARHQSASGPTADRGVRSEHTGAESVRPVRPVHRDVIRLMGISAVGHHGVFEAEKREGQPFAVDVVMHVDVAEAAATDDLTKTVNYAEVGDLVAGFIMGEPFDLIETLADRIAGTILQTQPLVEAVEVTVHKPQAPLPHEFHDVQVTVVRDRTDLEASR